MSHFPHKGCFNSVPIPCIISDSLIPNIFHRCFLLLIVSTRLRGQQVDVITGLWHSQWWSDQDLTYDSLTMVSSHMSTTCMSSCLIKPLAVNKIASFSWMLFQGRNIIVRQTFFKSDVFVLPNINNVIKLACNPFSLRLWTASQWWIIHWYSLFWHCWRWYGGLQRM